MSDYARKDFSDKVEEKLTPDSSKSGIDRTTERVTGKADRAARDIHSDANKSTTQELGDKASRVKDTHTDSNKSVGDKIKDAIPGMHSDKH